MLGGSCIFPYLIIFSCTIFDDLERVPSEYFISIFRVTCILLYQLDMENNLCSGIYLNLISVLKGKIKTENIKLSGIDNNRKLRQVFLTMRCHGQSVQYKCTVTFVQKEVKEISSNFQDMSLFGFNIRYSIP